MLGTTWSHEDGPTLVSTLCFTSEHGPFLRIFMREFSIREGVHEHKSETGHITDLGLTFTHSCEKTNKQALFLTIVAASLDLVPAVGLSSFCVCGSC